MAIIIGAQFNNALLEYYPPRAVQAGAAQVAALRPGAGSAGVDAAPAPSRRRVAHRRDGRSALLHRFVDLLAVRAAPVSPASATWSPGRSHRTTPPRSCPSRPIRRSWSSGRSGTSSGCRRPWWCLRAACRASGGGRHRVSCSGRVRSRRIALAGLRAAHDACHAVMPRLHRCHPSGYRIQPGGGSPCLAPRDRPRGRRRARRGRPGRRAGVDDPGPRTAPR